MIELISEKEKEEIKKILNIIDEENEIFTETKKILEEE